MLEKRFIEQDTVVEKTTFVTDDYSMSVRDYVVRADSTGGAFTITLPSVSEAAGRIYTFLFLTDSGDVTIQDQDESEDWSDLTMTAAGQDPDGAVLYSDGRKWWVLFSQMT
jgi:hypothetical protein